MIKKGDEDMDAQRVFERLMLGNERYRKSDRVQIDVSSGHRLMLADNGQHPFAVVICCSDSTVVPEAIFSCGAGELYVVRVFGNVIGAQQLAGIEYAVTHLDVPLIFVLGHDHCGAIEAALSQTPAKGFLSSVTNVIRENIRDEKDPVEASRCNVRQGIAKLKEDVRSFSGRKRKVALCGGIYHQISGKVEVVI